MAKISESQKKAVAKYNKEHYDRILLIVQKSEGQLIRSMAQQCNMSNNGFILESVREKVEKLTTDPGVLKQIQERNIQAEQNKRDKKLEKISQIILDNDLTEDDVMKLLKIVKRVRGLSEAD